MHSDSIEVLSDCPLEIPQRKKFEVDLETEAEKYLNVGSSSRSLSGTRSVSQSQDLSSSTSSINSGVHDSTLDITQIDPNTPIKHWKSPDDVRDTRVRMFVTGLNSNCSSVPDIDRHVSEQRFRSASEDNLNISAKLTEYERLEILKVLYDWSSYGSEAMTDANFSLKIISEFKNLETKPRNCVKFASEPDLSPKATSSLIKSNSEETIGSNADFLHDCSFANCIFNKNFTPLGTKPTNQLVIDKSISKPKGILKNSNERLDCLESTSSISKKVPYFLTKQSRRHSDVAPRPTFNPRLLRCGSLERLSKPDEQTTIRVYTINSNKKFPESYIVTKRACKCWRSCSDIKPQRAVKKCCRNAKNSCPLLKSSVPKRREVQSCDSINRNSLDLNALLRELTEESIASPTDSKRLLMLHFMQIGRFGSLCSLVYLY